MTRTEALNVVRHHQESLFAMGIEHAAIFGSTARDDARPESDLDLAISLRPDVRLGWDFFTLDERVGALLGVTVDLVTYPPDRIRLRAAIYRDRVDVF